MQMRKEATRLARRRRPGDPERHADHAARRRPGRHHPVARRQLHRHDARAASSPASTARTPTRSARRPPSADAAAERGPQSTEDLVWDQLRTCYDPEIPVNIVDLGLVYDCAVTPLPDGGKKVDVKFTLTAPGCGMGDVLREDIKGKLLTRARREGGRRAGRLRSAVEPPDDVGRRQAPARDDVSGARRHETHFAGGIRAPLPRARRPRGRGRQRHDPGARARRGHLRAERGEDDARPAARRVRDVDARTVRRLHAVAAGRRRSRSGRSSPRSAAASTSPRSATATPASSSRAPTCPTARSAPCGAWCSRRSTRCSTRSRSRTCSGASPR